MDDLAIKTALATSSTPITKGSDNASALAGLAATFQNLIHKTGLRVDSGLQDIADRAGISAVTDRSDSSQSSDEYGRNDSDNGHDRVEQGARPDDRNDSQSNGRGGAGDDDYAQEQGRDHRENDGENRGGDHDRDHADDHTGDDGEVYVTDDGAADGDGGEHQSADSDVDASDSGTSTSYSDGKSNTADSGSGDGATAVTEGAEAAVAQAGVSSDSTMTVLTGMVDGANALTRNGQASDQGKVSAADGLAGVAQKTAAQGSENVSATGADNMSATAKEATAKATPVSTGNAGGPQNNHQSQGQSAVNNQAQTGPNPQLAANPETDDNAQTTVETQASGLARAIGEGSRAQVTVQVSNESQTLTSKPGQALTANTVLNTEGTSQSAQNTGTHSQNTGSQNAAAQAQQVQANAVQNAATQNAQTQAATQANIDAKGLVQAQSVSNASGPTVHSGGSEGGVQANSSVSSTQQTQQTQSQSAASQTANTQKPTNAGNSVVEQISVKITKAIQSGNDKITIQLRPANMGRVEVKMELSPDNRLVALVTADNRETLDLLKNDSRDLERALQDAGLHTNAGDLNFNLRGQENQHQDANSGNSGAAEGEDEFLDFDESVIETAVISSDGTVISNGRVDVRA